MIHGQTLPANGAMQAVARKAGFEIAPDPDEPGVLRLEKRIGPHAELQRNAVSGLEPAAVDRWGAVLELRSALSLKPASPAGANLSLDAHDLAGPDRVIGRQHDPQALHRVVHVI